MKYLYPNFEITGYSKFIQSRIEKGNVVEISSDEHEEIDSFVSGCGVAILEKTKYHSIKGKSGVTEIISHQFYDNVCEFLETDDYYYIDGEKIKKLGKAKFYILKMICEKCDKIKEYRGSLDTCHDCLYIGQE